MLLTLILLVPLLAGLFCLVVPSRRLMEWLNVLAFAAALALGVRLPTKWWRVTWCPNGGNSSTPTR